MGNLLAISNSEKGLILQKQGMPFLGIVLRHLDEPPIHLPEHERQAIKTDQALEMISATTNLMPNGEPDFSKVHTYVKMNALYMTEGIGKATMIMVMLKMIKDFSENINVKTPLTTAQGMRIASFLCDDCKGMSLEDYQMMFSLAERGKLGVIYGRVDIQVIGTFKEAYLDYMRELGKVWQSKEWERQSAQIRIEKEQQRKALGNGDTISVVSPEMFLEEIKKLEEARDAMKAKFTLDVVKQKDIEAEMFRRRTELTYGMTKEEMNKAKETLQAYTVIHHPSKANKLTWEEAQDDKAHLERQKNK